MKIESKEDARKRGVPSPDRAEALMLALGRPPSVFEFYGVRDLSLLGGRASERSRASEKGTSLLGVLGSAIRRDAD